MATIENSSLIDGVQIAHLRAFGDDRGSFREIFRREWFPQRSWDRMQSNCSHSAENVLRGLHYHFHQVDYWFVPKGHVRAALFDMRPSSPTYLATQTVDMGEEYEIGLYIPIGIAHGFATLRDASLVYIVDNYYDGDDEHGVAWNDPSLNIDWGLPNPVVSGRDQTNPLFKDVPSELRYR